jgi:hypothetical protein
MQAGGHSQGRAMTQGSHFRRFLIQSYSHPSTHSFFALLNAKLSIQKGAGKRKSRQPWQRERLEGDRKRKSAQRSQRSDGAPEAHPRRGRHGGAGQRSGGA